MDVKFINPVLDSIVNILVTMANLEPVAGKPSIKSDNISLGVVTGMIDLAGKQANGSVAISFSREAAFEIVKRMLRTEPAEVDEMVRDLVGEIANMIAGGAKAKLQDKGYDFELSLPTVFAGEDHEVNHSVSGTTVVLPFKTDVGDFFVEICFA